MTIEAQVKELEAMQKNMKELLRVLNIAHTQYNHLNYRINQVKRKLNADMRKEQASKSTTKDTKQTTIQFNQ